MILVKGYRVSGISENFFSLSKSSLQKGNLEPAALRGELNFRFIWKHKWQSNGISYLRTRLPCSSLVLNGATRAGSHRIN